jgi:hypothetical protein
MSNCGCENVEFTSLSVCGTIGEVCGTISVVAVAVATFNVCFRFCYPHISYFGNLLCAEIDVLQLC